MKKYKEFLNESTYVRELAKMKNIIRSCKTEKQTESAENQPPLLFRVAAFLFLELKCRGIDAIAHAGGGRAVVEEMPEMSATGRAEHFGADHSETVILAKNHGARLGRRVKTRPAASGMKL